MGIRRKKEKEFKGSSVTVGDMPFEKALRLFKRKTSNLGLIQEIKQRREYVKPSTQRKLDKNAARKRWLKKIAASSPPTRLY